MLLYLILKCDIIFILFFIFYVTFIYTDVLYYLLIFFRNAIISNLIMW